MDFKIITPIEQNKMYAGQIIGYKIQPMWKIPISWYTEITHVKEFDYFIDEQRFGFYTFWHHEHRFIPISGGVEMHDLVYYKMPHLFGALLHTLFVKKQLKAIFDYRNAKLVELFGTMEEPKSE